MTEKELQNQIISVIDKLYDKIQNKNVLHISSSDKWQPYFSVNYLLREKSIKYGNLILKSLKSELNVVNGNEINNISMEHYNRLYPDILLYSPIYNKYIICELKRSSKAEREAITELLGYFLEVKNHLPLSNNSDIMLVIISTEFNTLLLHSAASVLLQDIPILCLKPVIQDEQLLGFKILDPDVWTNMDNSTIKKQFFEGITLSLYGKENKIVQDEDVVSDMLLACEYLTDDANRIRSNGFCIAWKSFKGNGISSQIKTEYFITIFTINPYKLYRENFLDSKKKDILSKHINQIFCESENWCDDFSTFTENAEAFLEQNYSPQFESPYDFKSFWQMLQRIGIPFYCDTWGDIGGFIKKLYITPAIDTVLDKSKGNFHNPPIFFSLLDYACNDYIFANGFDYCGDYFLFGCEIASLLCLLENAKNDVQNENLLNRICFKIWMLRNSIQETGMFFKEIHKKIRIDLQHIDESIVSLYAYLEDLKQNIDNQSNEFQALAIGIEHYPFFTDTIRTEDIPQEAKDFLLQAVFPFWCDVMMELLYHAEIDKQNLVDICYRILLAFFQNNLNIVGSIDSAETLILTFDTLGETKCRHYLKQLNEQEKIELLQETLYNVLNHIKALSVVFNATDINENKNLDELLYSADIQWLLRQIKKENMNQSDGISYLLIKSNDVIGIEKSQAPTLYKLYQEMKDNEVIVKKDYGLIEMYTIANIDDLLQGRLF